MGTPVPGGLPARRRFSRNREDPAACTGKEDTVGLMAVRAGTPQHVAGLMLAPAAEAGDA